MNWNPNAAAILGPELAPRGSSPDGYNGQLQSLLQIMAQGMLSTVSETVSSMAFYASASSSSLTKILAELLLAGQEAGNNHSSALFLPNGSTATNCKNEAGSTTAANLYQSVDEPVPAPGFPTGDNDYVESTSSSSQLNLEFNTAGALTGKRIKAVRLFIRAAKTSSYFAASLNANISGTAILGNALQLTQTPTSYTFELGEIYTPTGQPWTLAQLQALDTGTPRITIDIGNFWSAVRIYWVGLQVDYCDENRVSSTVVSLSGTSNQRITWTPLKPDGTSNFAKVSGTNLTFALRQPRYGQSPGAANNGINVATFSLTEAAPSGAPTFYPAATLNADGTVVSLGTSARTRLTMLEYLISGTESADSQVYGTQSVLSEVSASSWFTSIDQEFTPAATFSCAGVRLYGAYFVFNGASVPNLTVNLRTRSGSTLIATGTLTKAVFDAAAATDPTARYQPLQVGWAGGTVSLSSGTQYYVEVIPSSGYTYWSFPLMYLPGGATSEPQSWKGATDVASRNGTTSGIGDFPWILIGPTTPPSAPVAANMEAAIETAVGTELTPYAPGDCIMSGIPYTRVQWGASGLGAAFGYYEIQRMDTYTDWQTVAYREVESDYADLILSEVTNAYYRFRSAATVLVDELGHANASTSSADWGSPSILPGGGYLQFTAANSDYVQIPDADGWLRFTTDVSIEAWVNPATNTGADPIWLCYMGAGYAYELWLDVGKPRFDLYNAAGTQFSCTAPTAISTGSWHHIVASYAAGGMRLFVDDVEVANNLGINQIIRAGPGGCQIGRESGNYFDGKIAEVAAYNYALTQEQITNHYDTMLAGSGGSFDDYEARINATSCYRVRTFNIYNIASAWTATSCNDPLPPAGDGYTFTSNHAASSGVAYSDTYSGEATREYASPEASELVTMKLSGRDYVVAFQPCERRGVSFTRDLLISALRSPAVRGIHGFDALRDLAKMGLPYVCVRDENGDRFFAALAVPDFKIRNPRSWMRATVAIVEVADVATPYRVS